MRAVTQVGRVFAVLCLVVASHSCTEAADPETAEYWIDRLDDRQQRIEALKNLGRIGDKRAVPYVLAWFEKDGDWQPDAAYALGQLGDASVAPKLIAALTFASGTAQDSQGRLHSRTNLNIVRALAMLKAKEAAPSIKRLLQSGDTRVREAALRSLGDLGDPANTPILIEVALNEREPMVRLAAMQALGELGDPQAVPALIQLLFIEQPGVSFYEHARYALTQIGQAAVPDLLRTLERKNSDVEALKMLDGSPIAEGGVEAKAGSVLGALGAQVAAEPIATALARSHERAKKQGAGSVPHFAVIELAYALGNVNGPQAVTALLALAKDSDVSLRVAACEALTTAGNPGVVPQLLATARTGAPAGRRAAVVAASRLGTAADLGAFDALAKVGDATVPAAAMANLIETERVRLVAAKECGTKADCWTKKLGDPDPKVRDRAAYEIGRLGASGASGALLRAATDPDAEVRMAAVLSLSRLGNADPKQLEAVYAQSKSKHEYAGVNQELLRLIARSKAAARAQASAK